MTIFNRHIPRWAIVSSLGALLVIVGLVVVLVFLPKPAPFDVVDLIPGSSPTLQASPSPTPEPTLSPLARQRLTVLVIGADSSAARRAKGKGVNTDVMMLASVNASHSRVVFVSVPRDTVDVPLADGGTFTGKVNAIRSTLGVDALVGAFETLLAVKIDGYVEIDMDDLTAIVDAVGGVRVNPDAPLVDAHLDLSIPAGRQVLDGATALKYVRSRYTTNDFARAARQQEVLFDIVRRLVSRETEVDVAQLVTGLGSLQTDLPLKDLPTMFAIAKQARDAKVTHLVFTPPEFFTFNGLAGLRGYILEPNIEAMRAAVKRAF
jgi:LCP family protein required for cell wall assembly